MSDSESQRKALSDKIDTKSAGLSDKIDVKSQDLSDKIEALNQRFTEVSTRQETILETMNERLFGKDNQPGALKYLNDSHLLLADKVNNKVDESDFKELAQKHTELDSKVNWFSGVGATIVFIISTVLTYLGIHYPPPGH